MLFSAAVLGAAILSDLLKRGSKAPRAAEAFTGGGLYSLALHAEGFDVVETCEYNRDAVATLQINLYPDARQCDAREWTPPGDLDLLTGGPP